MARQRTVQKRPLKKACKNVIPSASTLSREALRLISSKENSTESDHAPATSPSNTNPVIIALRAEVQRLRTEVEELEGNECSTCSIRDKSNGELQKKVEEQRGEIQVLTDNIKILQRKEKTFLQDAQQSQLKYNTVCEEASSQIFLNASLREENNRLGRQASPLSFFDKGECQKVPKLQKAFEKEERKSQELQDTLDKAVNEAFSLTVTRTLTWQSLRVVKERDEAIVKLRKSVKALETRLNDAQSKLTGEKEITEVGEMLEAEIQRLSASAKAKARKRKRGRETLASKAERLCSSISKSQIILADLKKENETKNLEIIRLRDALIEENNNRMPPDTDIAGPQEDVDTGIGCVEGFSLFCQELGECEEFEKEVAQTLSSIREGRTNPPRERAMTYSLPNHVPWADESAELTYLERSAGRYRQRLQFYMNQFTTYFLPAYPVLEHGTFSQLARDWVSQSRVGDGKQDDRNMLMYGAVALGAILSGEENGAWGKSFSLLAMGHLVGHRAPDSLLTRAVSIFLLAKYIIMSGGTDLRKISDDICNFLEVSHASDTFERTITNLPASHFLFIRSEELFIQMKILYLCTLSLKRGHVILPKFMEVSRPIQAPPIENRTPDASCQMALYAEAVNSFVVIFKEAATIHRTPSQLSPEEYTTQIECLHVRLRGLKQSTAQILSDGDLSGSTFRERCFHIYINHAAILLLLPFFDRSPQCDSMMEYALDTLRIMAEASADDFASKNGLAFKYQWRLVSWVFRKVRQPPLSLSAEKSRAIQWAFGRTKDYETKESQELDGGLDNEGYLYLEDGILQFINTQTWKD